MFYSRPGLSIVLLIASLPLFLLPGCCKRQPYKPSPLIHLERHPTHYTQAQQGITLSIKNLSKAEAQTYFNERAGRLLRKRKPIYPLIVSVCNQSNKTFILDPKNITTDLVDPCKVASRLYAHTARRIVGTILLGTVGAAFSFLGAAYITIVGVLSAVPGVIKTGYALLGLSGFFVIGTPFISYQQGKESLTLNYSINEDLFKKTLIQPLIIQPGLTHTFFLFVHHKAYKKVFSISFIDQETMQSVCFDIDLAKGDQVCKN